MPIAPACLLALLLVLGPYLPTASAQTDVFINEIHYDNDGTDAGELIEIAGPAGTDVGGWAILLYNGANGLSYDTDTLAAGTTLTDPGALGLGVVVVNYAVNGIQNGAPDGIALVDDSGTVVEFLSYEGTFAALNGPANGMMSTDISVDQDPPPAVGLTLQRTGTGCDNLDFTWTGPAAASSGAVNAGQTYDEEACGGDPPPPPPVVITKIYEIQGAGHRSPYAGMEISTEGVVTAVAFDGYYVQDPAGDGDVATSDGIFVFVGSSGLKPAVGDLVQLQFADVQEFIPGGAGTGNLSLTELTSPTLVVLSNGHALPAPVVIGTGGRVPPNVFVVTPSETPVNLQTAAGVFNPAVDGIDFYESLEGMRVTVQDAVAVSALRRVGNFSSELFTLSDNGANAAPASARTARGGINLQPHPDNTGDQNPERVQIQFDASPGFSGTLYSGTPPLITVGDRLGDVTGIMSYDFGNFEVRLTHAVSVTSASSITRETTALVGDKHMVTIATYNMLNLSPDASDDAHRVTLADQIVNRLTSPDILALQEIQDNSGELDNGVSDASLTLTMLVGAIVSAGGPTYAFVDVAPANNSSGGVPGGNIRNAFLYNPERVQLEGLTSLTPTQLELLGVSHPTAFDGSRAPLLGEFKFQGQKVSIINNHLSSRSGSSPIFGGPQPFVQFAEATREAQAATLNDVVDALIPGNHGRRHIVVLGDFNTFEFANDLTELLPGVGAEQVLVNMVSTLTDDNVYSYNFEGNAQVLDHVFVSLGLVSRAELDIVHTNTDFPIVDTTGGSDHEPVVLRLNFASDNQ